MAGTTWPNLVGSTTAFAADVEAKFDWLEGDLVPMLGGSQTTSVYDLGTTTARWNNLHVRTVNVYASFVLGYDTNTGSILAATGTTTLRFGAVGGGNVPILKFYADQFRIYGSSSTLALSLDSTGSLALRYGAAVNEFSTDGTLAGGSDSAVPTEKAVKAYADAIVRFTATGTSSASATSPAGLTTLTALSMSLTSGDRVFLDFSALFVNNAGTPATTPVAAIYVKYAGTTYLAGAWSHHVASLTAAGGISIHGGMFLSVGSTGSNLFEAYYKFEEPAFLNSVLTRYMKVHRL